MSAPLDHPMSTLPHIPILRLGTTYRSVNIRQIKDLATGEVAGDVRWQCGPAQSDANKFAQAKALEAIPCEDLIAMSAKAGELFMTADLPLGDGFQSPEDYAQPSNQRPATHACPCE